MINELIFIAQNIAISCVVLFSAWWSLNALASCITVMTILANLLVTKNIILFGLSATATDAFMIGCVFSINLAQEYYGQKHALQLLWIALSASIICTLFYLLHLSFIPSNLDSMHPHFSAILQHSPRIILASLIAYIVSQNIEYYIYGILKKRLHSNHLLLRANTSMLIAQAIDTIIFSVIGLYGIINTLSETILLSYSLKIIAILIISPFLLIAKKILYQDNNYAKI